MSKERRRFFRIEDIVGLKTEAIDKQQIDKKLDSFWHDRHEFSIRNEFNYKLDQHQADLAQIKSKMPELGRYLTVLQEQLDQLTDQIINKDDTFTAKEKQVNISAQGISFISSEKLNSGDIIELHLQLFPSHHKIVVFSKVIDCKKDNKEPDRFHIALDFEHIHEADRELLIKHIHGKQLRSLGASRFEDKD